MAIPLSALYCISIQYSSTPSPCRPNLQTAPSAALPLSALAPHLMATSTVARAVAPSSSPAAHWSVGRTFRVPPGKMSGCCGLMATSRRSRFLGTACASSPVGAEHGQQQPQPPSRSPLPAQTASSGEFRGTTLPLACRRCLVPRTTGPATMRSWSRLGTSAPSDFSSRRSWPATTDTATTTGRSIGLSQLNSNSTARR